MAVLTIKDNLGGGAVSDWIADRLAVARSGTGSNSGSPDLTGLTNPAPSGVYSTFIYRGNAEPYTAGGFAPGASVTVRFHQWIDLSNYHYGCRLQDVVSGTFADTTYQGQTPPQITELVCTADSSGIVSFTITNLNNDFGNWLANGIELRGEEAPTGGGGGTGERVFFHVF